MQHFTVTFLPDCKEVRIHLDSTVLEAAEQLGIVLNTSCGGRGTCGKCAVILADGTEVLACRYKIKSDMIITVPERSRYYKQKILEHGIDRAIEALSPVTKQFIPADSITGKPVDIFSSVHESLAGQADKWSLIFEKIQKNDGITLTCHQYRDNSARIVSIEQGDTTDQLYGIAIDIGTTTVVAKLTDLKTTHVKSVISITNPQTKFGDDVISRINHAINNGPRELHKSIIKAVNLLVDSLCADSGISHEYIYEITAVGNTTMSHLFLNFPVDQLGRSPYKPHCLEPQDRLAEDLGINISPKGNIHVLSNIAGFIGSDTVAAGLAVGMDIEKDTSLVVDIGTNGELILSHEGNMYSASCAAGPALEGARIRHGSRAHEGAIEAVVTGDEDIDIDVIAGTEARTVCGSGLIDAAAVMLELGVLDYTGRFNDKDKLKDNVPDRILERIIEVDSQPAFILADGEHRVFLTQKDIRELQLAKAAIRTGIELLLKKAQITSQQVDKILLAGAFGNYIRRQSAIRIGMLPPVPVEKVHFVGNAAGVGAQMALASCTCRRQSADFAGKIQYVEIANSPDFQMVYADSMLF